VFPRPLVGFSWGLTPRSENSVTISNWSGGGSGIRTFDTLQVCELTMRIHHKKVDSVHGITSPPTPTPTRNTGKLNDAPQSSSRSVPSVKD
jgi:hypothetical protein